MSSARERGPEIGGSLRTCQMERRTADRRDALLKIEAREHNAIVVGNFKGTGKVYGADFIVVNCEKQYCP